MTTFVLGIVLPWMVLLLLFWIGLQLMRQNGGILLRLDALEAQVAHLSTVGEPESLPLGSAAPGFELPALSGEGRVSLEAFRGNRVLLLFFSLDCGGCKRVAGEIAKIPARDGRQPFVPLVVSTGDLEENRQIWLQDYALTSPVTLDEDEDTREKYLIAGTPTGYLIDEDGKIASPATMGAAQLLQLVETAGAPQTVN